MDFGKMKRLFIDKGAHDLKPEKFRRKYKIFWDKRKNLVYNETKARKGAVLTV